jgi:hypothetical protein
MQMVESADGTIKVIELDPTKMHWIIGDRDAMHPEEWRRVRMVDGLILLKRPGTEVTIVEGETMPEGVKLFPPPASVTAEKA